MLSLSKMINPTFLEPLPPIPGHPQKRAISMVQESALCSLSDQNLLFISGPKQMIFSSVLPKIILAWVGVPLVVMLFIWIQNFIGEQVKSLKPISIVAWHTVKNFCVELWRFGDLRNRPCELHELFFDHYFFYISPGPLKENAAMQNNIQNMLH
eukprot:TRINITY_DN6129_c0_g4_i7.p1 TRINITY_DN6129_c0_g4~~TRINITY_DN6129_c0_g4_i7.p1  ORF type:complete len:154 (+),score=19.44 TRINITY_DN6129_c0_g4_i7:88-549(+)